MLRLTSARMLRASLLCLYSAFMVLPASAANQFVTAGGDLQGALNQAQGGDAITLAAGATYVGHFYLPPNSRPQWITV